MITKIRSKNFSKPVQEIILNAAKELRFHPEKKGSILKAARQNLRRIGFQPPELKPELGDLFFGKILSPDRQSLIETAFQTQRMECIGKGGVNIVNLLQEVLSGLYVTERLVYKKEYKSFLENDEKKIFMNSCRRLIRLPAHPNVVQFLEYGQKLDGQIAYIFEYAPGRDFKHFIENEPVTLADFLQLCIKGLRSIRHLHKHGLVHCDIKPSNFCVLRKGDALDVNLIDFDFTRAYQAFIRDIKLKKIPGTIRFIPGEVMFPGKIPSQEHQRKTMAFANDIYAFGISLYYLLTKNYPPEIAVNSTQLVLIRKANKFFKKEELSMPFPSGKSREFMAITEIIKLMVKSDWTCRPSAFLLSIWLSEIAPSDELVFSDGEPNMFFTEAKPIKVSDTIGEYDVIKRQSHLPYLFPDGTKVFLALLRDRRDLRFLGIPNHFATKKEASSFFKTRSLFLSKLNKIREKHRDLFPGEFNIVLEYTGDTHTVWTIRPYLEGVITLARYMELAPQKLTKKVQFNILIIISRSLSALQSAGYVHSDLNLSTIFLVPPFHELKEKSQRVQESMIIDASQAIDPLAETETLLPLEPSLVPGEDLEQIDLPHTIELMDLNNSRPIEDFQRDPNFDKFIVIMRKLFSVQGSAFHSAEESEMIQHIQEQSKNKHFTWEQVTMILVNKKPEKDLG